uniref:ARAD1D20416p n=1 Tax=Blastobotrys adeninivorans TaxID=409370 RepID=A0A060TAL0_BLAAD
MGKAQKKFGKGRLDKYYHLAKEKGYRARSSFKIIQINQKFGHFLEKSKVVIDLCAAPGSWCQVAANCCPINSLIIGVDLAPIKPLPNVITFQSDITTEHCRQQLRGHMKTWKADTVMHDGAPNVGMAWTQDAFTQSELVLQSLKLAVEFLVQGGTFVTKVFRSKDYNNLMWVFNQFFDNVQATKPPSSRDVSAEIFVVCKGFKAPKKVDSRLLDSRHVFEELQESGPNYNARVFNPEKKTRKRGGYEEGDYLQHHTMSALEFIQDADPIKCLGSTNAIIFDAKAQPELKPVKKLPETDGELLELFKDLKVLGKKDFRVILKWRKHARVALGLDETPEHSHRKKQGGEDDDEVEVEPLTAEEKEEQISKELEQLQQKEQAKKKREKRKANEAKQREIYRMQMNMQTPFDIGIEAGQQSGSLFSLKQAEKSGKLNSLAKGKKSMVFSKVDDDEINNGEGGAKGGGDNEQEYDSEDALETLGDELDSMYQQYKERQAERDARYEAKRARELEGDDEFVGFSDREQQSDSDDENVMMDEDELSDSDDEYDEELDELVKSLHSQKKREMSRKATQFFDDPIFAQMEASSESSGDSLSRTASISSDSSEQDVEPTKAVTPAQKQKQKQVDEESEEESEQDQSDDEFEIVPADRDAESDSDNDWDASSEKKNKKPIVELATEQAMTMAHQLALGHKTKHDLIDEGYNRYSFRDKEGLPEWFLDDEGKHSKINRPITKEAAAAIKEKMKALNARPVKKVAEAQARKKQRALRRLEKLRKKSELINDDSERTEAEKSSEIAKLMKKMNKKEKTKPKVTVVVAKGANRRLQGRPRGVKGKYKMVDGTMKKEQRALRRIQKKRK